MKELNTVIIGLGLVGKSHIDALRRIPGVRLRGVMDINEEAAARTAEEHGVKRFSSLDEVLADPGVDAVHNCTPNFLHFEYNMKIIGANRHIFCEKPLAMSATESAKMLEALKDKPMLVHSVNHVYRMNPLVLEMRKRIADGEIGRPLFLHGSYLQDWALYDTDYNWRMDEALGGASRCMADIGTHWMDLSQTITGLKIASLCADLVTVHPTRRQCSSGGSPAFSQASAGAEFIERPIKNEDCGTVMFIMENGLHGVFCVSQVSAGRKCRLDIEINATKGSFYWNQENADCMWVGSRDGHNVSVMRNPNLMVDSNKRYTYLAAGHPEGWNDAMRNGLLAFYGHIRDGKDLCGQSADFATFHDAHALMKLCDAIIESNAKKTWIKL